MLNTIDRIQKILGSLFFLDIIGLIIFLVIYRSVRSANYFGYGGMFILAFLFMYTGYKRLSLMQKEGQTTIWYRQPWIMVGFMTCVLAILFLVTNK